ncbi:hypothetical protein PVAND_005527 [Polypedilum vanderplanki]|uniref:Phosphatidylcholine transfer protein n=1 Tax=Polypedilum vanderplanki TaxID=319348 RepID=A0A9J6C0S3_POLVA|nr:hypothetical protein PVAND_005527 [Polypedilum vanderplanki]
MFREQNFFNFIKKIKSNVKINRNTFYSLMAGPLYFTIEDWENNRIYLDDDAKRYLREFDFIEQLKNPKNVIENFSKECCLTGNNNCDDINLWEFYVQKDNMITWRREEEDNPGQYAYKVYVKYDDITAEDFLHVQMDIDYRREWDDTAVSLEVIDSDPFDNQQVIYWEMQWPKLFANRDYVFLRKCFIDRKRNLILICCKSINHPRYPENPRLERVKDYWSYMVIKPSTTFNQKGFEFSLTYYDNPGIKIPKYVTNYVSQRQLPEFIKQLYHATIKYAEKRAKESWKETKDPGFEYPSDTRLDDYENDTEEEHMPDNVNFNKQSVSSNEKEVISTVEEDTSHRKSWWSYLIPFYYHT